MLATVMKRRLPVLAIAGLSLCTPLQAETLAEAIALAYWNNPDLQAGRYDLRVADEDVVQARSRLRPTLDLEMTGQYDRSVFGDAYRLDNPFSPDRMGRDTARGQVVATQPLYTGGRATAERRIAEAGVGLGRETLRATEGDLLLGVITAYVDVRRYGNALLVWQTSVAELTKLADEIDARRQAGELTLTDVAQAQRQVALAREQVVLTEQALEAARTDYAALVGRDPGNLAPEPTLPQVPRDAAAAFDLAESRNPELAQARRAEERSRHGVEAAAAESMPTIGLRGSAALSGEALPYRTRDQNQEFVGALTLTLPLSAGGRIASQIRQAEDRNAGDRLRIESARRALNRGVNNAWNQVVSSGRSAAFLDEQRRAAVIQLEGSVAEYRVGLRSTFDVLFAQQTLRDVEVNLLAARRDRYIAEVALLRRTGLLEARAITNGVPSYDASSHYRQVAGKNALPWDGLISILDRAGGPVRRQKMIVQPAVGAANPMITAPPTDKKGTGMLSRSLPIAPIPGTVGQPVDALKREKR
jgi:outer membrane protein